MTDSSDAADVLLPLGARLLFDLSELFFGDRMLLCIASIVKSLRDVFDSVAAAASADRVSWSGCSPGS